MQKFTYIDLFAGAGGLSEGFTRAGFEPLAHVELDGHACKTIETRLVYHKLKEEGKLSFYYDYIRGKIDRVKFIETHGSEELSSRVFNVDICMSKKELFAEIDKVTQKKEVDLIIGGPPCQAYSLVGRSRDKNGMKGDKRNFLFKEYAKFLKYYSPKMFVFENVLGLETANGGKYLKAMRRNFKRLGYETDYQVQNSADFGVLQSRKRIILLGWKKKLTLQYPDFDKSPNTGTVSDLLGDLKTLKAGQIANVSKYKSLSNVYLANSGIRNGVDFVTQHIARPHNDRDLKIYKIAIKKWMKHGERLRYPDLPEELKTHKNEKSFVDRFKVVDPNGLSHTMVAHIAKDGHHYIHPLSKHTRSLSVREAARIQSFPDDFYFEGGRSAAFRQIGNAVPPLMAFEIARKIIDFFEK